MPPPDPGAPKPEGSREGHSDPPTITFEEEGTLTTREVPEEEQEEVSPHYQNTDDGEIIATRRSEESCEMPRPEMAADSRSEIDEEEEEIRPPRQTGLKVPGCRIHLRRH